jgi:hypothetical protein
MAAKQDTLNPFYREVARYLRENGIRSVAHVPKVLPDDSVLVHNFARFPGTSRALGHNGFRAWLQRDGRERLEPCDCDFAAELGTHYRVVRRPGGLPI